MNHILSLRDCDGVCKAAIIKANPLSLFPNGTNAIAIFNGEDSHSRPIGTESQDHRQVPTWNYQVVHLHGQIEFESSKVNRLAVVDKLTKK